MHPTGMHSCGSIFLQSKLNLMTGCFLLQLLLLHNHLSNMIRCKNLQLSAYINSKYHNLLPPANKIWDKVIFLYLFVILFTGACLVGGCLVLGGVCSGGGARSGGRVPGLGGGGCLVQGDLVGDGTWWRTTPHGRLLLRAVRILLEYEYFRVITCRRKGDSFFMKVFIFIIVFSYFYSLHFYFMFLSL